MGKKEGKCNRAFPKTCFNKWDISDRNLLLLLPYFPSSCRVRNGQFFCFQSPVIVLCNNIHVRVPLNSARMETFLVHFKSYGITQCRPMYLSRAFIWRPLWITWNIYRNNLRIHWVSLVLIMQTSSVVTWGEGRIIPVTIKSRKNSATRHPFRPLWWLNDSIFPSTAISLNIQ